MWLNYICLRKDTFKKDCLSCCESGLSHGNTMWRSSSNTCSLTSDLCRCKRRNQAELCVFVGWQSYLDWGSREGGHKDPGGHNSTQNWERERTLSDKHCGTEYWWEANKTAEDLWWTFSLVPVLKYIFVTQYDQTIEIHKWSSSPTCKTQNVYQ